MQLRDDRHNNWLHYRIPYFSNLQRGITSSDYTKNKEQKQNYKKQQIIKLLIDNAIIYITSNGEQGKIVRFEAATKEIRKGASYKNATNLEVAKVILDLK